jgi:hypothetical protein
VVAGAHPERELVTLAPSSRWIFISLPVIVLAAGALAFSVRGLLALLRAQTIATMALRARSSIALPSAGTYDLSVSGRLGTNDLAGLDFRLHDESGSAVPLRDVVMRVTRTSMSGRTTSQVRTFEAARGGRYVLDVTGIQEGSNPGNEIVIGRPAGLALVAWILAIVLSGALLILAIVASALSARASVR